MATDEELLDEIEDLKEDIRDLEKECFDKDKEIENLEEVVDELEDEVSHLNSQIQDFPRFKDFIGQEKMNLFSEYHEKFTLESFEKFIKENCK